MEVTLHRIVGRGLDSEIRIDRSPFLIGRAGDCDLRLVCPMVSRHHCEIVIQQGAVLLRDVGSKNGTFVEGERIYGTTELKDDDVVNMGLVLLRIQICETCKPLFEANRFADVTTEPISHGCSPIAVLDCSL